jgi:Fe-S-cluster containining protein
MPDLRFDAEQRFTCQQCARCCTRPWSIVVTADEREDYRRSSAERFFSETSDGATISSVDPFVPLPGGLWEIRKREGGACGFLSSANRCRLHEELGARRKPIACQVFPFRVHPQPGGGLITASSACPSVVSNVGKPLGEQARELRGLARDWARAFPESPGPLTFVAGHALLPAALETLESVLVEMLDRPGLDGRVDLRANVGRMAALVEDFQRWRVLRLGPERFADYIEVTGRHAARSATPAPPRAASGLARLLFRGFLFAVLAGRLQQEQAGHGGSKLFLRLRLFALLFHLHGLAPARDFDRRLVRRAAVDLDAPDTHALVRAHLRRRLRSLGTGRRPVVDELAFSIARLNAALVLASARAAQAGRAVADAQDVLVGVNEAGDLEHVPERSLYARLMTVLANGVGALDVFASGADGISRQPPKA